MQKQTISGGSPLNSSAVAELAALFETQIKDASQPREVGEQAVTKSERIALWYSSLFRTYEQMICSSPLLSFASSIEVLTLNGVFLGGATIQDLSILYQLVKSGGVYA